MCRYFSVAATIFTLIGPDKLKDLTNTITAGFMTGVDMDKVFNIGITLVILYASGTVLSILQGQIMAVVTQKISKNLRNEISEKLTDFLCGITIQHRQVIFFRE